jgi:hypothetical protein
MWNSVEELLWSCLCSRHKATISSSVRKDVPVSVSILFLVQEVGRDVTVTRSSC